MMPPPDIPLTGTAGSGSTTMPSPNRSLNHHLLRTQSYAIWALCNSMTEAVGERELGGLGPWISLNLILILFFLGVIAEQEFLHI